MTNKAKIAQMTDSATGVVYKVVAYRDLTRNEMIRLIATHKEKYWHLPTPARGSEVVIQTEIGLHDV